MTCRANTHHSLSLQGNLLGWQTNTAWLCALAQRVCTCTHVCTRHTATLQPTGLFLPWASHSLVTCLSSHHFVFKASLHPFNELSAIQWALMICQVLCQWVTCISSSTEWPCEGSFRYPHWKNWEICLRSHNQEMKKFHIQKLTLWTHWTVFPRGDRIGVSYKMKHSFSYRHGRWKTKCRN